MEWISVNDRLPELKQKVLLYGKGGRWVTALFDHKVEEPNEPPMFWAYSLFTESLEECEEITHWMPLPEPPKS